MVTTNDLSFLHQSKGVLDTFRRDLTLGPSGVLVRH